MPKKAAATGTEKKSKKKTASSAADVVEESLEADAPKEEAQLDAGVSAAPEASVDFEAGVIFSR